jgi:NADP-dependent 3-hydroxy acid dehydrogenase YdfG
MARVLITGSSTGIGRATAIELAQRGQAVVATARRPETLEDLSVEQRLALDVTHQASVDAALRRAGEIDVLVSNAGETYAQSKWALEGIAETLALELAQTGVHVTLIDPASIAGIGRSKAPVHRDEIDSYAFLWARSTRPIASGRRSTSPRSARDDQRPASSAAHAVLTAATRSVTPSLR